MLKLPTVEIADLNSWAVTADHFGDDVTLIDLDGSIRNSVNAVKDAPFRMNGLMFVLFMNGSASFNVNYMMYELHAYSLLLIMPTQAIQLLNISTDFKGKLLLLSRSFANNLNITKVRTITMPLIDLKQGPSLDLTSAEYELMLSCFDRLHTQMRRHSNLFQQEIVENALENLALEFANIFVVKNNGTASRAVTRKDELFEAFMGLLFEHCKQEHSSSFYAQKLCITAQYLTQILKEKSGKSTIQWINDALFMEAKILLKQPNMTVQQVSDELHFCDQSSFGKFFKKQMGISPLEYRKNRP